MTLTTNTFAKYLRLGLIPRKSRGNWDGGELMYSFYHDDVQYTIDDVGDFENEGDPEFILESLSTRAMIIERNHEVVKVIYNYFEAKLQQDIWVLVTPGPQLLVNFGNKDGIFAVFLMDFVDEKAFNDFKEKITAMFAMSNQDIPEIEPLDYFVLAIQDEEYDEKFSDFNVKGVELQLHNDANFGWHEDDEDDDE